MRGTEEGGFYIDPETPDPLPELPEEVHDPPDEFDPRDEFDPIDNFDPPYVY